jgi:NDP-sugar pyrophosphorylase family protein
MENVKELTIEEMYTLEQSAAKPLLEKLTYPWEALPLIKDFVLELGASLDLAEYDKLDENVWVHKSCKVYKTATILGPTVIGAGTEVRPGAFIRGNVLVGENCVIGNSTELKNVIIFNNVQVPHYNYVGDSVLGYKSHMGAGSITSNVKSDKTLVHVKGEVQGEKFDIATGMKKFGAMLGDSVEVGCNSVLNPGTVIGRNSNIYPVSRVRGYVPEGSIFKDRDNVVKKEN